MSPTANVIWRKATDTVERYEFGSEHEIHRVDRVSVRLLGSTDRYWMYVGRCTCGWTTTFQNYETDARSRVNRHIRIAEIEGQKRAASHVLLKIDTKPNAKRLTWGTGCPTSIYSGICACGWRTGWCRSPTYASAGFSRHADSMGRKAASLPEPDEVVETTEVEIPGEAALDDGRLESGQHGGRDVPDLDGRLFLTVPEFAELFRADPRSIRRGIEAGDIPAVKIGRVTRIPVPKVREMLGLD